MSHIMYNFSQRNMTLRVNIVLQTGAVIARYEAERRHAVITLCPYVYSVHLRTYPYRRKYTKLHRNYTIFYAAKTITPLNNVQRGNLLILHKSLILFSCHSNRISRDNNSSCGSRSGSVSCGGRCCLFIGLGSI